MTLLLLAVSTVCEFYHSNAIDDCDLAAFGANQPPIFKHLEGGGNARAPGTKHGRQKFMSGRSCFLRRGLEPSVASGPTAPRFSNDR